MTSHVAAQRNINPKVMIAPTNFSVVSLMLNIAATSIWPAISKPTIAPGTMSHCHSIPWYFKRFGIVNLLADMLDLISRETTVLRKNSGPWIPFTTVPEIIPTVKDNISRKTPVVGSAANNKNAASPIVDVKTAVTAPKLIWPLTYCVITTIAPPHPGKTPIKLAVTISRNGLVSPLALVYR